MDVSAAELETPSDLDQPRTTCTRDLEYHIVGLLQENGETMGILANITDDNPIPKYYKALPHTDVVSYHNHDTLCVLMEVWSREYQRSTS